MTKFLVTFQDLIGLLAFQNVSLLGKCKHYASMLPRAMYSPQIWKNYKIWRKQIMTTSRKPLSKRKILLSFRRSLFPLRSKNFCTLYVFCEQVNQGSIIYLPSNNHRVIPKFIAFSLNPNLLLKLPIRNALLCNHSLTHAICTPHVHA